MFLYSLQDSPYPQLSPLSSLLTPTTPPTMTFLADELIGAIVSNLEGNVQTLAALSRVSKQYHRVIEPYLYRHIVITKRHAPAALVRTIKSKKHLGEYTKTLVARRSVFTDWEYNSKGSRGTFQVGSCVLLLYFPNLEHLDVSEVKNKLPLRKGQISMMPWMACVKLVMYGGLRRPCDYRQLKRIDADIYGLPIASKLPQCKQNACTIPRPNRPYIQIYFTLQDPANVTTPTPDLYPAFALPAIETLIFKRGDLDLHNDVTILEYYVRIWEFTNPSIKHLSFTHPKPTYDFIALDLLSRTCPHLQSLTVIGSKKRGLGAFYLRGIVSVFSNVLVNPAFRHLKLWDEGITEHDASMPPNFGARLHLIARNPSIEELEVDGAVMEPLWDAPTKIFRLPPNLRTLHVRSATWMALIPDCVLAQAVHGLAVMVQNGIYARLENVVVEIQDRHYLYSDVWEQAELCFADTGVTFELRKKEKRKSKYERVGSEMLVRVASAVGHVFGVTFHL